MNRKMSRKLRMYGKSGMREIMAGHYEPINSQSRHGLTETRPSDWPDLKRQSETELENVREQINQAAFKKSPAKMLQEEFRERHGHGDADAIRECRDYLNSKFLMATPVAKSHGIGVRRPSAGTVWNEETREQGFGLYRTRGNSAQGDAVGGPKRLSGASASCPP